MSPNSDFWILYTVVHVIFPVKITLSVDFFFEIYILKNNDK